MNACLSAPFFSNDFIIDFEMFVVSMQILKLDIV